MGQTVKAIAESINIMGTRSGGAMKDRVQGPVQEMAKEEADAGASYLDLNIGPARKDGTELLPWVVDTVEAPAEAETVTEEPKAEVTDVEEKADEPVAQVKAEPKTEEPKAEEKPKSEAAKEEKVEDTAKEDGEEEKKAE